MRGYKARTMLCQSLVEYGLPGDNLRSELLCNDLSIRSSPPDERMQPVAQLGRSDELRQRTIELEQLLLNVPTCPGRGAAWICRARHGGDRRRVPNMRRAPRPTVYASRSSVESCRRGATAALLVLVIAAVFVRSRQRMPADTVVRSPASSFSRRSGSPGRRASRCPHACRPPAISTGGIRLERRSSRPRTAHGR